jgi:hypothetical protein
LKRDLRFSNFNEGIEIEFPKNCFEQICKPRGFGINMGATSVIDCIDWQRKWMAFNLGANHWEMAVYMYLLGVEILAEHVTGIRGMTYCTVNYYQ